MAVLVDLDDVPGEDQLDNTNGHRYLEKGTRPPQEHQLNTNTPAPMSAKSSPKTAAIEVSPANNSLERVLSIYP